MWILYASEIAACIGKNPFTTQAEAAVKVWKRCDELGYAACLEKLAVQEKPPIEEQIKDTPLEIQVKELIAASDRLDISGKVDHLVEKLSPETQKDVRSMIYTTRGHLAEDQVIHLHEKKTGTAVKARNDKFYKIFIKYQSNDGTETSAMIGGRIDGMAEDGTLVEVKNRQRRIFKTVPTYEKIQIMTYLVLTMTNECQLVQKYCDETKTDIIVFDEEYWKSVVKDIKSFCIKLDTVVSGALETKRALIEDNIF